MAGIAIHGLLGLISAAEAAGAFAPGNPGPVASGSIQTDYGHIVPSFTKDAVGLLSPYISGITLVVAGLLLVYRKSAVDNNHVEKWLRIDEQMGETVSNIIVEYW